MAIQVLKLNLVPAPTLWRQRHEALGWSGLTLGLLALVGSLTYWGVQAARIKTTGKESVRYSSQAKKDAERQISLSKELATLDISREMPRWRLAERIYLERGLPWSRITAELERSLVDGVRTKAITRSRSTDGTVELKLRGESFSREAEADFVENLQQNGLFAQVVLERESERQGGGIDFELRLPMVATPLPYVTLPTPEERQKAFQAKHPNGISAPISPSGEPPQAQQLPRPRAVAQPAPVAPVQLSPAQAVDPGLSEAPPESGRSRRRRVQPAPGTGENRPEPTPILSGRDMSGGRRSRPAGESNE